MPPYKYTIIYPLYNIHHLQAGFQFSVVYLLVDLHHLFCSPPHSAQTPRDRNPREREEDLRTKTRTRTIHQRVVRRVRVWESLFQSLSVSNLIVDWITEREGTEIIPGFYTAQQQQVLRCHAHPSALAPSSPGRPGLVGPEGRSAERGENPTKDVGCAHGSLQRVSQRADRRKGC